MRTEALTATPTKRTRQPGDHPFIPNAVDPIRQKMLKTIGVNTVEELYSDIPQNVRLDHSLNVPAVNSEQEVLSSIQDMLSANMSSQDAPNFLGAGVYHHYIPAAVKAIVSRVEFQTAYTPYQPEASQGLLQALFEFQSLVADLTGMDAVNSSVYDGSNAIAEGLRMAVRSTGRKKVLVPRCLHPDRLSVAENYTRPIGIHVEQVEFNLETGAIDMEDLDAKLDSDTAAVYYEVPSFFGILDPNASSIPETCHRKGSLAIVGFDPISLGGLRGPGEYGADIAVAEGQSISTEMNYGGPLLGIIGCRGESLIRQLPGRIIGQTTTLDGKYPAYSMVLQTREQHIRRERATSNICTNEALLAVGAAVYLALLGPQGLQQLFNTIMTKTEYAIRKLSSIKGLKVPRFSGKHYQDFVVQYESDRAESIHRKLLADGIHGGRILKRSEYPSLNGTEAALFSVTEQTPQEWIDILARRLSDITRRD